MMWQAPSELPELLQQMLPTTGDVPDEEPLRQRVEQALRGDTPAPSPEPSAPDEERIDFVMSYSEREVLQLLAERGQLTTHHGRAGFAILLFQDLAVLPLLAAMLIHLQHKGRKRKPRPIVVLCDISGSMEAYARMLLHFMQAITSDRQRVESFVFGTRLTRITRYLRQRDVDAALDAIAQEVEDWAGGTRIGAALKTFNYEWLRRTLRSGGVVLIISDGCDRGDTELLSREMARLARNCHRLLWLNPLLRYEGYEPLTQGMQAALPYIDDFLPVHNLESLEQLGEALSYRVAS